MIMRRLALLLLLPFASPALAETAQPPETSIVIETYKKTFAETCAWAIDGNMGGIEPQIYDLRYRGEWQEPTEPEQLFRIYEFHCDAGAYNFVSVYFGWDEVGGLDPISFAYPKLDIQYEDSAEGDDVALKSIAVTGYSATYTLTNANVDEESGSITSGAKWRGIGDAGEVSYYEMDGGFYVLKTHDVDPTYDGESNMIRTVDATKPINVPLVVLEENDDEEPAEDTGEATKG